MAQTIKIKRSTSTIAPSSLSAGELAYSSKADTQKLYIGDGSNVLAIGGKAFTDKLDLIGSGPNTVVATTQYLGVSKLGSDTEQSVGANSVSATVGRTYAVQHNSSDQMVVNVPWVTLPQATDSVLGGIKIGTGLTIDASTGVVTADEVTTSAVSSAGALMDSEVTNLAQVKAFSSADYATAAQGTLATNALPKAGGTLTGDISFGDSLKIKMGAQTGGDLNIYHDGTNSVIQDRGTGNLQLLANDLEVKNSQGNTFFQTHSDGETTFTAGQSEILKLLVGNDSAVRADTSIRINSLNGKFQTGGVAVADSGNGAEYCFEMFGSTNSSGTDHHGNVKVKGGGDLKLTTDSSSKTQVTAGKFKLASGTDINEFSIDTGLAGNSDDAVPTEKAVKAYVDGKLGNFTFNADEISSSGATMTLDPAADGITGKVVVNGDLEVKGTTTTIESTTIDLGDTLINLNSNQDESSAPPTSLTAGITVDRGNASYDSHLLWKESSDTWRVSTGGNIDFELLHTGNSSTATYTLDGGTF